jgi:hypothetical protein
MTPDAGPHTEATMTRRTVVVICCCTGHAVGYVAVIGLAASVHWSGPDGINSLPSLSFMCSFSAIISIALALKLVAYHLDPSTALGLRRRWFP